MSFVRRIQVDIPSTIGEEELSDALLRIATSKTTDSDLARELIEHAATELLSGRPLSEDLRDWLGWSLMAIARGVDPKTALCLQKRGAPAKVSWERVFPLVHDRIVRGDAWTTVCKDAAVELSESMGTEIDEKTVRLVYSESLKDWYDSWVIEEPVWEGESPSPEELQSFRKFTRESLTAIEAMKQNQKRSRR